MEAGSSRTAPVELLLILPLFLLVCQFAEARKTAPFCAREGELGSLRTCMAGCLRDADGELASKAGPFSRGGPQKLPSRHRPTCWGVVKKDAIMGAMEGLLLEQTPPHLTWMRLT